MLSLLIASSILALILLVGAIVEVCCRWAIEFFGRRAASRSTPTSFEIDERIGLLGEPNQIQPR